jgi:glycosyltransferase involved in cell wall biosynthesis
MENPVFSIILPFYKQSEHVERIYRSYCEQLDRLGHPWELVFVINGQDDGTRGILERICERENIVIESLDKGGWGRAVKHGLSKARGMYLCYTNTARTDISDLVAILELALAGRENVVKATRLIRESWMRRLGSTLYNIQFRLLFRYPVWDVNGTPKVLPRRVFEKIPITRDDDLIDAEIIANCSKYQIRVIEVPVRMTARLSGRSTTNMMSALRMFKGLYKLRAGI